MQWLRRVIRITYGGLVSLTGEVAEAEPAASDVRRNSYTTILVRHLIGQRGRPEFQPRGGGHNKALGQTGKTVRVVRPDDLRALSRAGASDSTAVSYLSVMGSTP
jgi:hypothetical protein